MTHIKVTCLGIKVVVSYNDLWYNVIIIQSEQYQMQLEKKKLSKKTSPEVTGRNL